MGFGDTDAAVAVRFASYVEGLASVIGHKDRVRPLRDYCMGLMMPCERKSVEPMAAVTAPSRTAAQHQSLLHFVGEGSWSDERVLAKVREMVLPAIERQGPIEAWIIDDTGFPKQGRHSVGVARQYCGQLGKQDNCQVAVSLSLANHHASLPVSYRLYLPKDWADDSKRRRKTGVPEDVGFKTKPEIALEQIAAACKAELPRADGRWLWLQHRVACRNRRAVVALCRRHHAAHDRVGMGHGAAAAQKMVRQRTATQTHTPRRKASTGLGQGACAWIAETSLAYDQVARGHKRCAVLALCAGACASSASRL
jgi:hypothetical protein